MRFSILSRCSCPSLSHLLLQAVFESCLCIGSRGIGHVYVYEKKPQGGRSLKFIEKVKRHWTSHVFFCLEDHEDQKENEQQSSKKHEFSTILKETLDIELWSRRWWLLLRLLMSRRFRLDKINRDLRFVFYDCFFFEIRKRKIGTEQLLKVIVSVWLRCSLLSWNILSMLTSSKFIINDWEFSVIVFLLLQVDL